MIESIIELYLVLSQVSLIGGRLCWPSIKVLIKVVTEVALRNVEIFEVACHLIACCRQLESNLLLLMKTWCVRYFWMWTKEIIAR